MLFAPKEKGQGLVEYAIILALVAIVVIAVMRLLGPKIGNTFSRINTSLPESVLTNTKSASGNGGAFCCNFSQGDITSLIAL